MDENIISLHIQHSPKYNTYLAFGRQNLEKNDFSQIQGQLNAAAHSYSSSSMAVSGSSNIINPLQSIKKLVEASGCSLERYCQFLSSCDKFTTGLHPCGLLKEREAYCEPLEHSIFMLLFLYAFIPAKENQLPQLRHITNFGGLSFGERGACSM